MISATQVSNKSVFKIFAFLKSLQRLRYGSCDNYDLMETQA